MVRWVIFLVLSGVVPAVAQEREWSLGAAGEDVFLAFGVPETADIGVSFWCRIGANTVSVFAPLPPLAGPKGDASKVSLEVGGKHYAFNAKVIEKTSVEATLKPQEEMLSALKRVDRFVMQIGGHKTTYPLAGADFDGLVAMCANTDGVVE